MHRDELQRGGCFIGYTLSAAPCNRAGELTRLAALRIKLMQHRQGDMGSFARPGAIARSGWRPPPRCAWPAPFRARRSEIWIQFCYKAWVTPRRLPAFLLATYYWFHSPIVAPTAGSKAPNPVIVCWRRPKERTYEANSLTA